MVNSSVPPSSPGIDCHVHVFRRDLLLAPSRRYAPDYDAHVRDLLSAMQASGLSRAVVVQPSFLGTDNSYLLETVGRAPEHFVGIAVVEPEINASELAALKQNGIVGIRLNCIGNELPLLQSAPFRQFAERLATADMVLEIQAEAEQWRALAPALPGLACRIVIDHFGRTAPGHASGGFELLLEAAARVERIWYKFSGPYRLPAGAAQKAARAILSVVGSERIVWGSDWPWTQYEERHAYRETLGWLSSWVPDGVARRTILAQNAFQLFRGWGCDDPARSASQGA